MLLLWLPRFFSVWWALDDSILGATFLKGQPYKKGEKNFTSLIYVHSINLVPSTPCIEIKISQVPKTVCSTQKSLYLLSHWVTHWQLFNWTEPELIWYTTLPGVSTISVEISGLIGAEGPQNLATAQQKHCTNVYSNKWSHFHRLWCSLWWGCAMKVSVFIAAWIVWFFFQMILKWLSRGRAYILPFYDHGHLCRVSTFYECDGHRHVPVQIWPRWASEGGLRSTSCSV